MKYQLRYFGDPVLRQKAAPVEEITDEIRELVQEMIVIMKESDGIGIAAPQVGVLKRLFVSICYDEKEGQLIYGAPYVYINPKLTNPSETMVEMNEGCLSIPKISAAVLRPLSVEVEAMDLEGNIFRKECYGYFARHIMHENDHLNGVLYIDRIKGKRRTALEPELRRIKQQYCKK
ncbi:MAG: peptide deformylase [Chlamydiales bacterium]